MSEMPDLLRAFVALAVVIVLMIAIAQLLRRLPGWQRYMGTAETKRMQIVTSLMLDAKHRLVIVKIDNAEKTFLLSPESAVEVVS